MKITYKASALGPTEIAPGLYMHIPGVGTITGVDLEGSMHTVEMTLDMTAEGVRPTSVNVTSQDSSPITGTTLRSLRVWDMAREILVLAIAKGEKSTTATGATRSIAIGDSALTDNQAAKLRAQGPNDESLKWVAYFYNLAGVLGLPPARQVEVNLRLPRTTATKWVKRARDKGLLGMPETGGRIQSDPLAPLPIDEMLEWLGWEDNNGEHQETP